MTDEPVGLSATNQAVPVPRRWLVVGWGRALFLPPSPPSSSARCRSLIPRVVLYETKRRPQISDLARQQQQVEVAVDIDGRSTSATNVAEVQQKMRQKNNKNKHKKPPRVRMPKRRSPRTDEELARFREARKRARAREGNQRSDGGGGGGGSGVPEH